jgi:hypothetical protein
MCQSLVLGPAFRCPEIELEVLYKSLTNLGGSLAHEARCKVDLIFFRLLDTHLNLLEEKRVKLLHVTKLDNALWCLVNVKDVGL